MGHEQLQLPTGPLFVVEVMEAVGGPLTGRDDRRYSSPPQSRERALELAMLLLDRGQPLSGAGPWRVARPGGQRTVRLIEVDAGREA